MFEKRVDGNNGEGEEGEYYEEDVADDWRFGEGDADPCECPKCTAEDDKGRFWDCYGGAGGEQREARAGECDGGDQDAVRVICADR